MRRRRKRRKKKRRRKVYFKATSFIFGKDLGATARRGEGCDLRTGCDLSLRYADQEFVCRHHEKEVHVDMRFFTCYTPNMLVQKKSACQHGANYRMHTRTRRECVCCLLVLDSVTSTPQWIHTHVPCLLRQHLYICGTISL